MQNRVVIITGASSGIGAATAKRLARSSRLMLVARRQDRLRALAEQIADEGGTVATCACDLLAPGAIDQVIGETLSAYGGIDCLINNAGVFLTNELPDCDQAHVESVLQLNVQVPILLTRAAVPHLARDGGGWVVNVSSIAATTAFTGCGVYAASKAAIEQWSAVIREELRAQGVRVSVIAPGATATGVWPPEMDTSGMSRPEDIAAAIHYSLDQAPTVSVDRVVVTPPGGAL